MQSSWDWSADARFARALGLEKEADVLDMVCASGAVTFVRDSIAKAAGHKVKRLRLAALRRLAKERYVEAHWVGLGPGGLNTYGCRRCRDYSLTADGKKWTEERLGVKSRF